MSTRHRFWLKFDIRPQPFLKLIKAILPPQSLRPTRFECNKHIEAKTKWPPFARDIFNLIFLYACVVRPWWVNAAFVPVNKLTCEVIAFQNLCITRFHRFWKYFSSVQAHDKWRLLLSQCSVAMTTSWHGKAFGITGPSCVNLPTTGGPVMLWRFLCF